MSLLLPIFRILWLFHHFVEGSWQASSRACASGPTYIEVELGPKCCPWPGGVDCRWSSPLARACSRWDVDLLHWALLAPPECNRSGLERLCRPWPNAAAPRPACNTSNLGHLHHAQLAYYLLSLENSLPALIRTPTAQLRLPNKGNHFY